MWLVIISVFILLSPWLSTQTHPTSEGLRFGAELTKDGEEEGGHSIDIIITPPKLHMYLRLLTGFRLGLVMGFVARKDCLHFKGINKIHRNSYNWFPCRIASSDGSSWGRTGEIFYSPYVNKWPFLCDFNEEESVLWNKSN